MLASEAVLDLAEYSSDAVSFAASEMEKEIKSILLSKSPILSPKSSFQIAESLIDSAVSTITTFRSRIRTLETERDRLLSQEGEWEALLAKWRDMAVSLKEHVRDLEGKLAQANQKLLQAELRAQAAEEDILAAQQGSLNLYDKVIAAFGADNLSGDRTKMMSNEAAGNC